MSSWKEFTQEAPELAAFGKSRFHSGVAYLGTIRPDGGPRVHPVTPIVGEQLFLFMEPTSPKGKDLQRDPRCTLHCSVEDSGGGAAVDCAEANTDFAVALEAGTTVTTLKIYMLGEPYTSTT